MVVLLIVQILREFKNRQKAEAGLKRSYKDLAQVNQENAERNWLLSGLNIVNDILQGQLAAASLSHDVLNAVINYLNAKAGAFYVFNDAEEKLCLRAAYALPNNTKPEYRLNEGFVGQAAAQKDPLVIADIPPKYAFIEGGVTQLEPVHAIYVSLFYQGELKGIIEILSFKPVENHFINFLKMVSNNIAAALHSVQAREKVMQLFERVQMQKEELEKQQEELRQTNEELVVQAEVLQTSEEEMKVQEEELRQINSELAKKNEAIELARLDLSEKANNWKSRAGINRNSLPTCRTNYVHHLNSVLILQNCLQTTKTKT